jgi:hypothetical protein
MRRLGVDAPGKLAVGRARDGNLRKQTGTRTGFHGHGSLRCNLQQFCSVYTALRKALNAINQKRAHYHQASRFRVI